MGKKDNFYKCLKKRLFFLVCKAKLDLHFDFDILSLAKIISKFDPVFFRCIEVKDESFTVLVVM